MSQILKLARDKWPQYDGLKDDQLVTLIAERYPQYLDADKDFAGEFQSALDRRQRNAELREQMQKQEVVTERAAANASIATAGEKFWRGGLGLLEKAFTGMGRNIRAAQEPMNVALQANAQRVVGGALGREPRAYDPRGVREYAEEMQFAPEPDDSTGTKVVKGLVNTGISVAADLVSPEGILTLPLGGGAGGSLARNTLRAALIGQGSLAAEGGIQSLRQGDVQQATTQLAGSGLAALGAYSMRKGGEVDFVPATERTAMAAAEALKSKVTPEQPAAAPATAAAVEQAAPVEAPKPEPARRRVDVEDLDAMDAAAEEQAMWAQEARESITAKPEEVIPDATEVQRQGAQEGPVDPLGDIVETWIRKETKKASETPLGSGGEDAALKVVSEWIRKGETPDGPIPDSIKEALARRLEPTRDLETGEILDITSQDWPRTGTLINFLEQRSGSRIPLNFINESSVKPTAQKFEGPGAATPEDIERVSGAMRTRKFHARFKDTEEIQLETRQGTRADEYLPRSHEEVATAVNSMIERGGIDTMIRRLYADDPTLPPDHKIAAQEIILKRLNDQAKKLDEAGQEAQANYVRDTEIELIDRLGAMHSTEYGRGVAAHKMWAKLSPQGMLRDYVKTIKDIHRKVLDPLDDGLKETADIVRTPEFKAATPDKKRQMLIDAFKKLGRASNGLNKAVIKLVEASSDSKVFDEALLNAVIDALKLPKINNEFARKLLKQAQEAQKLPEGFQRDYALWEVAKEMRNEIGVSGRELAKAWWYASILSGPPTQGVNVGAGALKVLTDVGVLAAIHPMAATQMVKGLIDGALEGFREARAIVVKGDYSRRERGLFEPVALEVISDSPNLAKRVLSKAKYVGRLMTAADMINFKAAEEAHARLTAWKQAKKEGARGDALQRRVDELLYTRQEDITAAEAQAKSEGLTGNDYNRRVDEIIEQKRSQKMMDEARQFGLVATYNNTPDGFIGDLVGFINRSRMQPGVKGWLMTVIAPFARVVGNVFSEGLNWTPWGYARWARMIKEGKGWTDAGKVQHVKAAAGVAAFTGLYSLIKLFSNGKQEPWFDIYGPGPEDPDRRNGMRQTGWRPNTIKIGNTYVSYINTPMYMPLASIGYLRDAEKYKDMSRRDTLERFAFVSTYAIRSIFDQNFLSGVSQFVEGMSSKSDGRELAAILQRAGTAFVVPNFVKWMDRIWDPTITSGDTLKQRFMRDIPVARSMYGKPMLNALGDPVERDGWSTYGFDRFWTTHRDDPLYDMFQKKGIYPSRPSKNILLNGEFMTPEQYYEFSRIRGQLLKQSIQEDFEIMQSMEPEEFQTVMKRKADRATDAAKREMAE